MNLDLLSKIEYGPLRLNERVAREITPMILHKRVARFAYVRDPITYVVLSRWFLAAIFRVALQD